MPGRRGEDKTTPALNQRVFLPLAGFVVLLDQFTKALAQNLLVPGLTHPVLPPVFFLTLVQNRGIAFGLFQDGEKILLLVITLSIAVLAILGFRDRTGRFPVQVGIGLILGGAVGNLIDRLRAGAVIDFLDFRVWPVFNFADTAITIGVGLFLLESFKPRKS